MVKSGVRIAGNANRSEYYNQPLAVQLSNKSWIVVLTNADHTEGQPNQRVASRLHVSPNLTEGSWLPEVDIEHQPYGPSAGWAAPLYAPELERLYAFYTFNEGNITTMPGSNETCACQLVGGQWYRWSDDFGATWSAERMRVPIRVTSIDRENPWKGSVLQGWTVSKPIAVDGAVLMPYTKIGTYVQSHERQWVLRSDNVLTERDARKIRWTTWPDGDGGCGAADGSDEAEEGGLLDLGGGVVLFIFRSSGGRVNECVSRDGGRTWAPRLVYYAPIAADEAPRPLKNPRGPLTARKLADGSFLLLYFNNGWKGYSPHNDTRNPYFLSLGRSDGDRILWSQPEVALYGRGVVDGHNPTYDLAYPDVVEETPGGRVVIFEAHEGYPGSNCNDPAFEAIGGCGVATHVVDARLLAGLRGQNDSSAVATEGLALDAGPGVAKAPRLPVLDEAPGGVTVEAWLQGDGVVLDCRRGDVGVRLRRRGAVVSFDVNGASFDYAAGADARHVAVVVDGGPRLATWVVDGHFGDGGEDAVLGYAFFDALGDANGAATCAVGAAARRVRVYGRYLRTSELVANHRAGPEA